MINRRNFIKFILSASAYAATPLVNAALLPFFSSDNPRTAKELLTRINELFDNVKYPNVHEDYLFGLSPVIRKGTIEAEYTHHSYRIDNKVNGNDEERISGVMWQTMKLIKLTSSTIFWRKTPAYQEKKSFDEDNDECCLSMRFSLFK